MSVSELTENLLYHRCDPESIPFDSTDEVSPLDRLIATTTTHSHIGQ